MPEGRVLALAVRAAPRATPETRDALVVVPGESPAGDHARGGRRGVTFLDAARWADTMREVGRDLSWTTRRANVLAEGLDLIASIGRRLAIGDVEIEVHGETHPCAQMDEACDGLKAALGPDGRGGVYGRVERGGTIRVGDAIRVEDGGAR